MRPEPLLILYSVDPKHVLLHLKPYYSKNELEYCQKQKASNLSLNIKIVI